MYISGWFNNRLVDCECLTVGWGLCGFGVKSGQSGWL